MRSLISAVALAAATVAAPALSDEPSVPYPDGYRDWHHVKSMVINEGHALYEAFGGIHHIYANEKAVQGYQAGRFPDGAVIVFDLLEAHHEDHTVTEGARKVAGVMYKDAEKYAETGGWGFEAFAGGEPARPVVGDQAASACFSCHLPMKERDYVFSSLRD